MKNVSLLFILIIFSANTYSQEIPAGSTFILPQFQGGMPKFHEYLNEKLHYPPVLLDKGFEGKFQVKIFVGSDGVIRDVIAEGKENEFSNEVKRVLSGMPAWTGASLNGTPVDTFVDKYIYFSIDDSQIKDDTTVFECLRYKKSKGKGRKVYAGTWDEIQSKIYYANALDDLFNKNCAAAVDMFIQAERKGLKSIDLFVRLNFCEPLSAAPPRRRRRSGEAKIVSRTIPPLAEGLTCLPSPGPC